MPLGFNQDVSSSQSSKQIVRHGASFVRTHPQLAELGLQLARGSTNNYN
jgi:hypothetical protein